MEAKCWITLLLIVESCKIEQIWIIKKEKKVSTFHIDSIFSFRMKCTSIWRIQACKMNTARSLRAICCLFCPPCPSSIVSKIAFMPPPPSYTITRSGTVSHIQLNERAEWQYTQLELDCLEAFTTVSSRGKQIACVYVNCCQNPKFVILFSHGNGVDLGQMLSFYILLGTRINCNILGYDYSGYGASSGKPSEKNLYADADAAYQGFQSRFGFGADKVIFYGQSIGTVPTIDLASKYQVAGVILHSALMSGMRVAFPDTTRTYCFDAFPRYDHYDAKLISHFRLFL